MLKFNLQARLTQLQSSEPLGISNSSERNIWILRDDELGGFWGTKCRKFYSIIEYCLAEDVTHIICTGGINSNSIAAAAVLCREAGIVVTAFAVDDHSDDSQAPRGNRLIIRTAIPPERLIIVPRNEKQSITERMQAAARNYELNGSKVLILEEGGGCQEAVKGGLTLADDVLRPRPEWSDGDAPAHIFIDSGTGLSAACLAAGLSAAKTTAANAIKLHVIQMAGFDEQIQHAFNSWVTPVTGVTWDNVSRSVRVYRPLSPRSYGATSSELFDFIKSMAREQGILTDPVYSAKLFARAFDLIKGQNLKGRILIVHTGGISGLLGYSF
jgi:1-aminocyclopropane-1-carboxylate deaminase/D-cysteine desulfhydrase-like pyridoxal-dependent ACC family enzyme